MYCRVLLKLSTTDSTPLCWGLGWKHLALACHSLNLPMKKHRRTNQGKGPGRTTHVRSSRPTVPVVHYITLPVSCYLRSVRCPSEFSSLFVVASEVELFCAGVADIASFFCSPKLECTYSYFVRMLHSLLLWSGVGRKNDDCILLQIKHGVGLLRHAARARKNRGDWYNTSLHLEKLKRQRNQS